MLALSLSLFCLLIIRKVDTWIICLQQTKKYTCIYIYYSQKVRNIRHLGEIYGKCKRFTLQWYHIMKAGRLSRSLHWWFLISNYLLKQKPTTWRVYHKCQCLNNLSCALEHQLQLDNDASCCSLIVVLRLFLKSGPLVIEVLWYRVTSLYKATQLIP